MNLVEMTLTSIIATSAAAGALTMASHQMEQNKIRTEKAACVQASMFDYTEKLSNVDAIAAKCKLNE